MSNAIYDPKSLKAEEFINDGTIPVDHGILLRYL